MEGEEKDIEVFDVDNYSNKGDKTFSHQTLVMSTMKKALENGAKEMRAGWFETKYDKNGNLLRSYNEDTRLAFISSIESVMMVMSCDLDEQSIKEINDLLDKLNERKKNLLDEEEKEWNSIIPYVKQKLNQDGKGFIKGYFNKEKRFYQLYIEEKINIYREIFKSLTNQTSRKNFYQEEDYEN